MARLFSQQVESRGDVHEKSICMTVGGDEAALRALPMA